MQKNNLYQTKDQFISSVLSMEGMKIERIDKDGKVCHLSFGNFEKCKEIVHNYLNDKMEVSPRKVFDSFKNIKSIIYNAYE